MENTKMYAVLEADNDSYNIRVAALLPTKEEAARKLKSLYMDVLNSYSDNEYLEKDCTEDGYSVYDGESLYYGHVTEVEVPAITAFAAESLLNKLYEAEMHKDDSEAAAGAYKALNLAAISLGIREKEPEVPEGAFAYAGYHFIPVGVFPTDKDFRPVEHISTGGEIRICKYTGKKWSMADFYAASSNSGADIFHCVETGEDYVPGTNELFLYLGEHEGRENA